MGSSGGGRWGERSGSGMRRGSDRIGEIAFFLPIFRERSESSFLEEVEEVEEEEVVEEVEEEEEEEREKSVELCVCACVFVRKYVVSVGTYVYLYVCV